MNTDKKLKEIHIKNHMCLYFDHIININDIDLDNILLDEKTYADIGSKPLHTIFDKEDWYIRKYDRTKYLALLHSDKKYE